MTVTVFRDLCDADNRRSLYTGGAVPQMVSHRFAVQQAASLVRGPEISARLQCCRPLTFCDIFMAVFAVDAKTQIVIDRDMDDLKLDADCSVSDVVRIFRAYWEEKRIANFVFGCVLDSFKQEESR